jgi:hypothetical protein
MANRPAPGRRRVSLWLDGPIVDRHRKLAGEGQLTAFVRRALAQEVERLEREARREAGEEGRRARS